MNWKALSGADVARAFGVDRALITRWKRAGMPHTNGVFDLSACIKWRLERAEEEVKPASPDGERWLTAFRRERARLAKLDRLAREGSLISRDEVAREWAWRCGEFKTGLLGWASRLPPLLEGKDLHQMRMTLRDEADKILGAYSRDGRYTPRPAAEEGANGPKSL